MYVLMCRCARASGGNSTTESVLLHPFVLHFFALKSSSSSGIAKMPILGLFDHPFSHSPPVPANQAELNRPLDIRWTAALAMMDPIG